MTTPTTLSPLDAAFLHIEADGTPMHMASIGIFEGAPLTDARGDLRIDDLRRLISSRLALVPKLRQRPAAGLLGEAPPTWVDDPDFDVARHLRTARLDAPGGEAELLALCGERLAEPLDPTRPLWELVFVTGLQGEQVAVIEKLHHCMADGIAAAELAMVLLDLSPDPSAAPDGDSWTPHGPVSGVGAVGRDLWSLAEIPIGVGAWCVRSALHPWRTARRAARAVQSSTALWPPSLIGPSSSLNAQIGPQREVHFVRMDLATLKDAAHGADTTVNDVVLAIVSGGLHRLLEARGELKATPELQVLSPVGLGRGEGRAIANTISALFVRLPVHEEDPEVALASIASRTQAIKHEHQELAPAMALRLLDPLPQSVLGAGSRLLRHQPFFNLIVTNVPGPDVALYALGARMLEAFPIVPLAGNQALGVAALSYNGQLNLGVFSDPQTCPDVAVFCDGLTETLQRLTRTKVPPRAELLP